MATYLQAVLFCHRNDSMGSGPLMKFLHETTMSTMSDISVFSEADLLQGVPESESISMGQLAPHEQVI